MRKLLRGSVISLAVLLLAATAWAGAETFQGFSVVRVIVNGREIQSDVPAINFYGRTMLPVRAVAEAVGMDVAWDGATSTATLTSKSDPSAAAARAELEGYLKANKPSAPMPVTATSGNGIVLTLHGVELATDLGMFSQAGEGNSFVVADVSIYNGSQQAFEVNPLYVRAADTDARIYTAELAVIDGRLELVTLAAGDRVRGKVAFELPKAVPLAQVRLSLDPLNRQELILNVR